MSIETNHKVINHDMYSSHSLCCLQRENVPSWKGLWWETWY